MKKPFTTRRFKHWLACSLILFFTTLGAQQTNAQKTVSGRVANAAGEPLVAATVNNKTSKKSTITNAEGSFTIAANTGDRLEVSHTGMKTQDMVVEGTGSLTVTLTAS